MGKTPRRHALRQTLGELTGKKSCADQQLSAHQAANRAHCRGVGAPGDGDKEGSGRLDTDIIRSVDASSSMMGDARQGPQL
jgi:hypothetical protein